MDRARQKLARAPVQKALRAGRAMAEGRDCSGDFFRGALEGAQTVVRGTETAVLRSAEDLRGKTARQAGLWGGSEGNGGLRRRQWRAEEKAQSVKCSTSGA